MAIFTVFMRSLAGGLKECEVSPDTLIDTLRQEHSEREKVPEFHEVRICHSSGIELSQGTVEDAGLSQGDELSVVVSAPEQHKLVETIVHLQAKILRARFQGSSDPPSSCEHVRSCVAAVRLLGQYETFERATVDAFADMLLDETDWFLQEDPTTMAVGEVFGRICNPASEFIDKLIDHLPCPGAIIALDGIDFRGEFPHQRKVALMGDWMQCFPTDIGTRPETIPAFSRLIARMNDPRLSLLLQEFLTNHLEPPLDEVVYKEAMTILGVDAQQEPSSEGMGEGLGSLEAQQEKSSDSHDDVQTDPVLEEQADLQKALLLSKADSPALSCDDVVIFRLTRYSQDIEAQLCMSEIVQRVRDAGCEVRPDFSEGIFLVPITAEQYKELGLDLQKHHVLALRGDHDDIAEALRPVPKTKRPRVHYENHAKLAALAVDEGCKANARAQVQTPYAASPPQDPYPFSVERVLDHVARTFIHYNMSEVSEVSSGQLCHSAPAGDAESVQPRSHRRFK